MISYSYEKFKNLLEKTGLDAATVSRVTGIAKSTFSDWKSGRSKPKIEKIYKIAKFFEVQIEYFIDQGGD